MPPTTIRIGDTYINYGRIEPFATMFTLIIDTINSARTSSSAGEFALKSRDTVEGLVKEKTFLRGLSDFLNMLEDPEHYGIQWVSNIATGFVPNIVRQPIRVADPYVREYSLPPAEDGEELGFLQSLALRVGYNIVPQKKPVKIDVWGREVKYGKDSQFGPVSNYLLRLFSPAMVLKKPKVDGIDVFSRNYNEKQPDRKKKIFLEPIRRSSTYVRNGRTYKITLTDKELEAANRESGKLVRRALGTGWIDKPATDANALRIKKTHAKIQKAMRKKYFYRKLAERMRADR
jgi:hypothetical protein